MRPSQRNESAAGNTLPAVVSLPALAAALRVTGRYAFRVPARGPYETGALVPMYRVDNGGIAEETQAAVHVIGGAIDRLQRLSQAYGEWRQFDAGAYFDLTRRQTDALIMLTERVSTVHVTLFADLLLPSFRRAATFWLSHFTPAHAASRLSMATVDPAPFDDDFISQTQPAMVDYWEQLNRVVWSVRKAMADDPGFMATVAAPEERARWRRFWYEKPVPGLGSVLAPPLESVPTLTLSYDFPLPAFRQSGRLRRLRKGRARRRRLHRIRIKE